MRLLLASTSLEEFLAEGASNDVTERVQRIGLALGAGGVLLVCGLMVLLAIGSGDAGDRNLLRRLGLLGGLLAAFGAIVETIALANRYEVGWFDALRADTGTAPMMRLLAGVMIVAGLAEPHVEDEPPPTSVFATVGVAIGLLSFAFDGHTVSRGPRVVHAFVDFAHVGAAGVWFGGVVGLAALAMRGPLTGGRALVVHRFATAAAAALVVASIAGAVMASFILDEFADLTGTDWGRVLLVKILLVAVAAVLGGYHHFVAVPRVQREVAKATERARLTLLSEAVVLVAVLVLTGWLLTSSPV